MLEKKIPVYFHEEQTEFKPKYEWALGNRIKHPETTRRAESIFKVLSKHSEFYEVIAPKKIPTKLIRSVHSYSLINLYNTASNLNEDEEFYPSVFPQRMNPHPDPTNIKNAGFYCFDSGTPLAKETWLAASWSAACAFEAANAIVKKSRISYSLSRPPGHHASTDTYGGYCYLNNAAIAATHLKKTGRVAIVDIDFHHGNGTQDIFYRDDQVLTISLHGDPRHHFPYFCGFPSEIGEEKGEGHNINLILTDGMKIDSYIRKIKRTVFPLVKRFGADYLIICAGFDTYEKDPIGSFMLKTEDYFELGKVLSTLGLPTAIIQEGGYFTKDLGKNVHQFLQGFVTTI